MGLDMVSLKVNAVRNAIFNQAEPIEKVISRYGIDFVFKNTKKFHQEKHNHSDIVNTRIVDTLNMIEKNYYPIQEYPEKWI